MERMPGKTLCDGIKADVESLSQKVAQFRNKWRRIRGGATDQLTEAHLEKWPLKWKEYHC